MKCPMNIFIFISLFNLIFMTLFEHPMMKGFLILIQTANMSFFIVMFKETSWFSMILMLMFLGGILILFIYVISLIQNNSMTMSVYFPLFLLFFFFLFWMKMNWTNFTSWDNFNNFITKMTKMEEMKFLFFIFSKSYYKMSMFFILYLFISMISMISMISSKKKLNSSEISS